MPAVATREVIKKEIFTQVRRNCICNRFFASADQFCSDSVPEFSVLEFHRSPRPRQMRPGGVGISPATTPNSAADADDSNYHAIQAKDIIELELDDSRFISHERQVVLRSALQLVNEIAERERRQSGTFMEDGSPEAPTIPVPEVPPRELLFMLLRGIPPFRVVPL